MIVCEKKEMKEKIEFLKKKMVNCADKNGNKDLRSPEVYEISKQLDEEILKYMN